MDQNQAASSTGELASWSDHMDSLVSLGQDLISRWRPDGASEAETQDMNRLAMSILAAGYLSRVYTNASRPVLTPMSNYAFNQVGPSPDYVYSTTEIDPAGTYEITGFRGTSRFVEVTQQRFDMLRPPPRDARPAPLAPPPSHDLDDLDIHTDGSFRVLLSAERPSDHDGDWWELEPTTIRLLVRKCACDWINEIDARIAINRLDAPEQDVSAEETARRLSDLRGWVEGTIGLGMDLVRHYHESHGTNTILRSTKIDSMEGLPTQAYYDGIFEIADNEALVLETEVPEVCRYWQILVADDRFSTVDWVNRQSSLNDLQAVLDPDGRFRAVISRRDPAVPNWLDKADHAWGLVQMRWNRANRYPEPTMRKVLFSEIRHHVHPDTRTVSAAERAEELRRRRTGAQLRRIW